MMYVLKRAIHFCRENMIAALLAVLFLICTLSFETFLSVDAISSLMRGASATGLMALGMMLVILCGDIDLSVGSVLAIGGVVFVKLANLSVPLAVIAAVAAGVACGFCTALLTVKVNIPAFIASLSTQYAIRGIVYIVTEQKAISVENPSDAFSWLGNGMLLNLIPVQSCLFLLFAGILAYLLKYTAFCRSIYATGGNREAAHMLGVKTDKTRILAFVVCGAMSALAGMVTASRLGSAQAVAGEAQEMTVIAAIVLGGVLLRGGVGKVSGVVCGVFFIRLLTTLFNNIQQISTYWQNVITGILLLVVVFFQAIAVGEQGRRRLLGTVKRWISPNSNRQV